MRCPKCHGLMYTERFADYFHAFYAWKCINCGTVIDSLIALNRARSLSNGTAKDLPKADRLFASSRD